jgi:hypothetical protein
MFSKSVDSIVSNIAKQIDALHDAATRHVNEMAAHNAKADVLRARSKEHEKEAFRAMNVRDKLKDLIS